MGKGDKKSKRGKIVLGSFGVRRSRKKKSGHVPAPVKVETAENVVVEKAPKTEKVKTESTEKKATEKKPAAKKAKTDSE